MTERERCELCGGVKMGAIFWSDDAPKDEPICRRGRVAFSGPELDGEYDCAGKRFQRFGVASSDIQKEPER